MIKMIIAYHGGRRKLYFEMFGVHSKYLPYRCNECEWIVPGTVRE